MRQKLLETKLCCYFLRNWRRGASWSCSRSSRPCGMGSRGYKRLGPRLHSTTQGLPSPLPLTLRCVTCDVGKSPATQDLGGSKGAKPEQGGDRGIEWKVFQNTHGVRRADGGALLMSDLLCAPGFRREPAAVAGPSPLQGPWSQPWPSRVARCCLW